MIAPAPAPLVTVITPTYNHAAYIGRCLESVLAQTEPRWEQIVVDDGSTDETAEIIGRFTDPRIRLVAQPHRGIGRLGDAYNLALELARGEYVAVLEGDDFWPPDKLERQLPAFADPAVVLAWGQAAETGPTGEAARVHPASDELRRLQGFSMAQTVQRLLEGNPIPACTVVCRTTALRAVGGFHQPDGLPNVDYPTWLQLSRVGSFAPIDAILGYYRRHEHQVSATMTREMLRNLEVAPAFVEGLDEHERETLGVSVDAAWRIARQGRAAADYYAGRMALREGRRRVAAASFRRAVRRGGRSIRLRALVGLASLALRTDLFRVPAVARRLPVHQGEPVASAGEQDDRLESTVRR